MQIPSNKIGLLIEKFGETIKSIHVRTRAHIQILPAPYPEDISKDRTLKIEGISEQIEAAKELISEITRDSKWAPYSPTRPVELTGTSDQVAKAKQLIKDVLAEIGPLIGKSGETIKSIQVRAGARIQIETAKELVSEVCWIGPKGVGDGTTEGAIGSHASSVDPSHTREGTDVCCLLPLISEVREENKAILSNIFRLWPSTFVHLGGASSISRKLALDSLVSFVEVPENMSLPGATPEDFDSARDGLEVLTHFKLEVDWLRKRLEQMASLSELPVVRDRLEKVSLRN
ncbi:hypothetical protein C3L33_05230, partial [Rhododendron williamsianum]